MYFNININKQTNLKYAFLGKCQRHNVKEANFKCWSL